MKLIDKFLKKLKTDRNTFLTYILTLITIYLVTDRLADLLIMIFTGVASSYWNPIQYTLAFACPVFAFLFSCSSKYAKSQQTKVAFLYSYVIALYILIISMVTQWINAAGWLLLFKLPNYPTLAVKFSYLIKPVFCWISLYMPLTTFYPVFKWIYTTVNDTLLMQESIYDYKGINLAPKSENIGPNTCEITLCKDFKTGKTVTIVEKRRMQSMLVVGVSGSGKTSLIYEPMIARDIDKKYTFREQSKEMAFVCLKAGIANLKCPYDNDYINQNFNLNMIEPNESKLKVFKSYMKKMIYDASTDKLVYRNLGLTYISPDYESTSRIIEIANAYKMHYNLIDPKNPNSPGLNPFAYDDPIKTSVVISTVLKGLTPSSGHSVDMAFQNTYSYQVIENLSILLKIMYPRLHNGDLPTLEDMLNMLNDFSLIETMCKEMEKDEGLATEYSVLITYFKKNFYADAPNRETAEKFIYAASSILDNLLRHPGIKNILCNRTSNIDFDTALANGDITLLCTRRGDLGPAAHKAFGLFFILSMQYAVLRRPGNENSRIPHFLYIDEFADYICGATETIFTTYRKYKVGSIISFQSIDQLNVQDKKYRNSIISNCANKVVFGHNSHEDNEWWSAELGRKKKWEFKQNYDTEKGSYSSTLSDIKSSYVPSFAPNKIDSMKFKQCMYKIIDEGGKYQNGIGQLDFVEAKYKEKHSSKKFNFTKYSSSSPNSKSDDADNIAKKKRRTKLAGFSDDDNTELELDPVRTDISDSLFNTDEIESAIVNVTVPNDTSSKK